MAIIERARTDARHKLTHHFDTLLGKLEPPPDRLDAAQKYPDLAREFLKGSGILRTKEPHTRLSGSYARHVAGPEIKDVDTIVVIEDAYGLADPLAALEDLEKATNSFRATRDKRTRVERLDVDTRRQRRSVRLHFTDDDFYMDLVPALARGDVSGALHIPDRTWKQWVTSYPVGYLLEFTKMNKASGGKLVPLVKLIKCWRSCQFHRHQVKSFWLESLVVKAVRGGAVVFDGRGIADIVADTFVAIDDYTRPYLAVGGKAPMVPDPMIATSNVAHNWARTDFETFTHRLAEARASIEVAVTTENKDEAIAKWQAVFGESFTLEEKSWVAPALKIGVGVAAGIAATYLATRGHGGSAAGAERPAPTPPPPPFPHRFYGRDDEAR